LKKEVFPKHGYPTNKTTSCFREIGIIGDEVGITSGTVQTLVVKYFGKFPEESTYSLAMMRHGSQASCNFHSEEV
jgi:uncharacterized membrane protein